MTLLSTTTLRGPVIRGDSRGRQLGFPTANLALDSQVPRPPDGIYAGRARLESMVYNAVIHLGPRPTIPGAQATCEVHLLDFPDRDLYGATLKVYDLTFLRSIQKFATLDALRQAIARDCQRARRLLQINDQAA